MKKWYWFGYFLPALIILVLGQFAINKVLHDASAKMAAINATDQVAPRSVAAPEPEYTPLPFPDPPAGYVPEPAEAPKPHKTITVAMPEPGHAYAPSCVTPLMPLQGWNDQPNKNRPGTVHTNLRVVAKTDVRAHPCLEPGKVYHLPYGRAVIGGKLPKE
ncbi:MAG TPA: hypothetical protein VMU12_03070 [Candidatus Paceibacterota bacterium]|nr:hypothetical protein [Candidatus Paceibacterota bacterium]